MFKTIRRIYQNWIVRQYEKIIENDKGRITFLNTIDNKDTVERLNNGKTR